MKTKINLLWPMRRPLRLTAPLLLAGALAMSGCAEVGTLWYTAFGNPSVPAVYTPPKMPTLVLVENGRRASSDDFDADLVATQLSEALKEHHVCPLVDGSSLLQLRDTNPQQYRSMSITQLAKSVGAKQVLYVTLEDATGDPELAHAAAQDQAAARVKMVDVASGADIWPLDNQAGYPMTASVSYQTSGAASTDSHTQLLANLSDSIAKLFYSYSPDSSDNDSDDKPHVIQDM